MQCSELEKYLNTYLNVFHIPDSCPNGLQIEGKREFKKLATAVSANLATLQLAAETGVDALIVHHGLFWERDSYPIVGSKKSKIALLLKSEMALFAYHLPLDLHSKIGNNWVAAQDLGWNTIEPFGEYSGSLIGVKGKFAPLPINAFVDQVETYYQHPASVAYGGKEVVESAALISGGAYKALDQAARAGVDCYITGNFDEPAWSLAHEEKIHFLALGHSATERVGVRALACHLQKTFSIPTEFLDVPNPF